MASIALGSSLSGAFSLTFQATPSSGNMDGVIGLALGQPADYAGLAAIVRFSSAGTIDARNGGTYSAASTVPYVAGDTYAFRLVVDVPAHAYSIYVTPPGGTEIALGSNWGFRTEQDAVSSLDTLNVLVGPTPAGASVTVSNMAIAPVAASNTTPTVASIANQTTSSGGQVGPISFTISGSSSALTVSASSSNQTLVPDSNIAISGSGASRSITVFAANGQSGSATITVSVSDGLNTSTSSFTVTFGGATSDGSGMLNLSSRVMFRQGSGSLIPGFVVSGTQNKRVLLRVVGPTLQADPFNMAGALPDPQMTLKRWNGAAFVDVANNSDWGSNANVAEIRQVTDQVSAFPLVEGSHDAVLLLDLAPGQYTIMADDATGADGLVIVEIYDADTGTSGSSLINMSNRGYVGTGGEVMISGFVVSQEGPKTLLIRAVGPGLAPAPYNVANTVTDPKMDIYRRNADGTDTLVLTHDNWSQEPDAAEIAAVATQVSAFPLPAGSKDAAAVVTMNPGVYTVVVSGVNGATGNALVEVYSVQ